MSDGPLHFEFAFAVLTKSVHSGPIRQIPGTHTNVQPPPRGEEEPPWMKLSTCVGAPAGAGVFRDHRAWVRVLLNSRPLEIRQLL